MSEDSGEEVIRLKPRGRREYTLATILTILAIIGIFALIGFIAWIIVNSDLGFYLYLYLPIIAIIILALCKAGESSDRDKR